MIVTHLPLRMAASAALAASFVIASQSAAIAQNHERDEKTFGHFRAVYATLYDATAGKRRRMIRRKRSQNSLTNLSTLIR